jgi:hypothetical protein
MKTTKAVLATFGLVAGAGPAGAVTAMPVGNAGDTVDGAFLPRRAADVALDGL